MRWQTFCGGLAWQLLDDRAATAAIVTGPHPAGYAARFVPTDQTARFDTEHLARVWAENMLKAHSVSVLNSDSTRATPGFQGACEPPIADRRVR